MSRQGNAWLLGPTAICVAAIVMALPRIASARLSAPDTGAPVPGPEAPPQAPEVPPPAAPVPPPEPPAVPPVLTAPPSSESQLRELDQRTRAAEQRLNSLEAKLEASGKEGPAPSGAEVFFVRSPDRRSFVQVRGLLQVDTRWFLGNDTVANNVAFNDNDAILIRRFRPEIGGTLVGLADFLFSPDFAGASATIFDAFIDVHPFPWLRLRVGKQKEPLGLERLQAEGGYPFIERALDQNLTPGRDIGADLWGDMFGGIASYHLGVWDGFPDNSNNSGGAAADGDTDHAKDFTAKLFFQPLKFVQDAGSLGIGLAANTGNHKGRPPVGGGLTLDPTYRSAGQLAIFTYAVGPASDTAGAQSVFVHLRETHINPQFYYYRGPVGVLAEYVWAKQGLQRGNTTLDLTNRAYHVSASYVFGGTASYDGATPYHPLDPASGELGSLEIALRYDALKIDDATFDRSDPAGGSYARGFANPTAVVSSAQGWTGAAVYSPSRTLRFYVNFEQTFFKDGGAADPTTKVATNRKTESVLFGRVHVKF